MIAVYKTLKPHDEAAIVAYGVSEEILMENAARGVREFLIEKGLLGKKTLIVTGGGNNGADGLSIARMIPSAHIFVATQPKSNLCITQLERAKKLNLSFVNHIDGFEVIIDALLGGGATKQLGGELRFLVEKLNVASGVKIAVDMPSGIRDGMGEKDVVFAADFTVTFGAPKEAIYLDYAKDYIGEVYIKELGLPTPQYLQGFAPSSLLFEKSDFYPPIRVKKNCNKGDFGRLCIVSGDMPGASVIAAKAALRFGAGLVAISSKTTMMVEPQIMTQNALLGSNATLIGQGLGNSHTDDEILEIIKASKSCVVDADIFKKECIKDILALDKRIIFTPHPKELSRMLKIALNIDVGVDEIQRHKFDFARLICGRFPNKCFILKGANTLVAINEKTIIMPHGSQALAKAGSGDALAGVVSALCAQGYSLLDAATNGVAAISFAAANYKGANYSLTIDELLDGLKWL